jgi:serine phosphatase RsbU (regulator of sigma subunit)
MSNVSNSNENSDNDLSEQLKALEEEKKKFEAKNKKLWAMSEAVHKAKHKVDEQNEFLQKEKEKLEAEKKKLDEKVKKLWQTSTAVHKEKERINELKNIVEEKHQSIVDSVTYAKRIQDAILPTREEILSHLPDSFILFKPRDIVSGDFYWFSRKENHTIIACCDCTGHGVPGAFMSMIGNTLLNLIVNQNGITDPGQILFHLDLEINKALKQKVYREDDTENYTQANDGMDLGLCSIEDLKDGTKILHFSGANRPLYFISSDKLLEYKSEKYGIGGTHYAEESKTYRTETIPLQRGDIFYLSSDGFADQFNENDKKLMTRRFKEELLAIHHKPMQEQGQYLDDFVENWKGNTRQMDDICVIGVKI